MAAQAMAEEKLTYRDVERLCERHLARRSLTGLVGYCLVRYERCESQRFRPAFPHVHEYLLERIDFDRAFGRLEKRHQKVLIAWYGMDKWTQQQAADWLGCSPSTLRSWKANAIRELRDLLDS